jgi:thiol-disulfide isomerase/thioredoxin
MSRSVFRQPVPPGISIPVIGLIALAGVGGGYLLLRHLNQPPGPRPPISKEGMDLLPEGTYPADPLPPGTKVPPLAAAGWINGRPPAPGGFRLLVLDLWADWCPACRQIAPGLMRVYQKYRGNGVAFVSMTPDRQEGALSFVEQFKVPWACGYGVPRETIAAFGAYNADRLANYFDAINLDRRRPAAERATADLPEAVRPRYELSPMFYVIGRDGRVLWHDGQARPRHTRTLPELLQDLEDAIERGLATDDVPAKREKK